MATDFKRLDLIDNEIKYAIFGYIRENQHLFASNEYNIFNNIPDLIPSLCILYFDFCDFFKTIPSVDISFVDGDKKSIVSNKNDEDAYMGYRPCFGSVIIPSDSNCICKWDLKIINLPNTRGTCIIVGVASTEYSGRSSYKLGDKFYIYSNFSWCKDHIQRRTNFRDRRMEIYKTGDIITITLDLKKKIVSFCNNTSNTKLEIDMEKFEGYDYRLAVGIREPNVSVCIDKFSQIFTD